MRKRLVRFSIIWGIILLISASPLGAMAGFLLGFAMIIAAAPVVLGVKAVAFFIGARDVPYNDILPSAATALHAILVAVTLGFLYRAYRCYADGAQARALDYGLKALSIPLMVASFILCSHSLKDAWP